MKVICADLFCGGGGTSTGLLDAANELELEIELIAINHWQTAIATHTANHPAAKHICASVEEVRPRDVVPGGRLHLLVASPECTHHSIARGGKPVEDQKRVPAWAIIHWAQELYIDSLVIENVPEFKSWGPLGANGKPLKSKKGETYQAFLQALRSLSYRVEERVLCCADYGDPTTRKRLFIIATRRGTPTWPVPSHTGKHQLAQGTLFASGPLKPWRAAREIIDWTLKGKNIFDRKKPLAVKTLQRIAAGMKAINGIDIEPFLATRYGDKMRLPTRAKETKAKSTSTCEPFLLAQASGGAPRSVNEPVPTICTKGAVGMLEPFVVSIDQHGGNGDYTNSVSEPLTTITTKGRHALTEPFLVGAGGPGRAGEPRSVQKPLHTVLTRQSIAMVQPFLVAAGGPEGKGRTPKGLEDPLDTVLTENHEALVNPFLVTVHYGDAKSVSDRCQSVDAPLPTLTCKNGLTVIDPFLLPHQHGNDTEENIRSVEKPMPTVTATSSDMFLVEPYITKFYGTGVSQPIDRPLDTVTSHDRFGLVDAQFIPLGTNLCLGIRFRMLQPHELAAAQGFPRTYTFTGKKATRVKQIGNAVPCNTAKALCRERLKRYAAAA